MPFSALRFLVLDDHPFHRAVMVHLLQSLGAAATLEADDGLAGLEVILDASRPVDIVISDISMPRMDGLEFVRRLAEIGAPVSLIVSSALDAGTLASVAAMARAYGTRLLGVIGKPPTAAKLLPLVQAHVDAALAPDANDFPLEEITTSWVSGDFDAVFEPQVAFADRRLLALHAGLCWHHPAAGPLEGAAFHGAIRTRGLQEEFAWYLLEAALAACRRWRERGLLVPASIPLMLDELTDLTVAERVAAAARDCEVPPDQVTLCLRAGALGPDARALENIARFRMHGFRLAVEGVDASAGPARGLRLEGISELRLQTDVLLDAADKPAALASVERMLAFATMYGLRTVGCRIRSAQQWQLLQAAQCTAAEGAWVAPPLAVSSVLQWARQWESRVSRPLADGA
jgi:EAL domain-containing protein (putative c-di-GMP-specific phosphodiesterase class I)